MAIQKEIWAADIAEKLFPDNSYIAQAVNQDMWVDGKTVHLPNAGAVPEVLRNRSSLPATATNRTDTINDYDIDEFTSTPNVITDIEEIETSYAKRTSILTSHSNELNKQIANWMGYKWAPTAAANFLRTTGSARVANVVGATGNRKMLAVGDIVKLRALFDDMDIPADNRNLLLPSHMYNDLLATEWQYLLSLDKAGKAKLDNGNITMLFGFNIWTRGKNNILTYTNAATPVPRTPDASALTTANAAALAWHKDFVGRAKGDIKIYANEDDPTWYGSIFSAMVRAGGKPIYSDATGVAAIIEDAAA